MHYSGRKENWSVNCLLWYQFPNHTLAWLLNMQKNITYQSQSGHSPKNFLQEISVIWVWWLLSGTSSPKESSTRFHCE